MRKKATFLMLLLALASSAALAAACDKTPKECEHEGGTATCQTRAICDKCGEEYGELGSHVYGEWKHNDAEHWKECVCGEKSEEAAHEYSLEKHNETKHWTECVCGAKSGEENHEYSLEKHDETKHWTECECGTKSGEENHEFSLEKHDETKHWKECECGAKQDEESHTLNEWAKNDEQHWKKCACGYESSEKENHEYNTWLTDDSLRDYKACECGAIDKTVYFNKKVNLINQKLLMTNSSFALNIKGVSEYASVESIKLGKYDLGKDLTSLAISPKLKADTESHGNQTITVVLKDSAGDEHEILVPVTLITKEVANADDFKSIQPSSGVKGVYGYYVLTKDFSDNGLAGNAYADDWEETTGFFGTFDGQGHTISTAANGGSGIFGILRGATIKNVIIKDNWRSAYANYALLAKACLDSTLENVTFTLGAGNAQAAVGVGYGWLCYAEFSGNTLIDVTVNDTKGYGSLFGYKFANNVFDNVQINGTYTEMGHTEDVKDTDGNVIETGKSVAYEDVNQAEAVKKITLEGRQDFVLDGTASLIDLDNYGDGEVLSIKTSTGYELYSLYSNDADEVFKAAKQAHGEQNIIVTVLRDGKKIEVIVPVTVITKEISTMSELQSAVKCVGVDIYGYYALGKDVSYTEDGFEAVQASGGWASDKAFRGTLDGRTYTITTDSSAAAYGLFGTLNGSTIKNVTIKDAKSNTPYRPLLARNAYNTTFDGVTIEVLDGTKLTGTADNTPIVGNTMQKCVWKNCKITSSVEIENVFANQSNNDFSGGLDIIATVTGGFSITVTLDELPEGVTYVKKQ